MTRRVLLVGAGLLGLGLAGCFLPSQYDPFAPGVTVVIENASGMSAEIYLIRDRARQRLGQLPNGQVGEFLIPWREGSFAIRAELPQRQSLARSISARPGETFRYRLEDRYFTRIGEE